jgi:hypothetical protein
MPFSSERSVNHLAPCLSRHHAAVQPPSTNSAPVTNEASSLARKTTHQPTFFGRCPAFHRRQIYRGLHIIGHHHLEGIGVRIGTGCTELTRILSGAYRTAVALVRRRTAPLVP